MINLHCGVAYYGTQDPKFWVPFSNMVSRLHAIGIRYRGCLATGSMMTDGNRNETVKAFLNSPESEWILWCDTDNDYKINHVKRMFAVGKSLVSGVYFGHAEPYHPIAYMKKPNGFYRSLSDDDYRRGEIIPIDMAGQGFLLVHRSVYDDIQKQFRVFQSTLGDYYLVHEDDIIGEPRKGKYSYDYKIYKGELRMKMIQVDEDALDHYPFYQMNHGRTEDVIFFERAKRAGHQLWLDTSLEAGHGSQVKITGQNRRNYLIEKKRIKDRRPVSYEVTKFVPSETMGGIPVIVGEVPDD
jgi:hypothetical protein